MSQKYIGGFITKSPVAPTSSAASGMWTLDQAMQLQKQGNWPNRAPSVIGQAFGGGYYAGQIGVSGVATHYLIVGPLSSAQTQTSFATGSGSDPTDFIDGPTNSSTMNNASHPAAQFCEGLTIGGFSDWYLPAKNELEVCYYNLKPTLNPPNTNDTSSGINANAVPARASNYTTGTPARTTATAFITGGTEFFTADGYWSSTQAASATAWRQVFTNGYQGPYGKTVSAYFVRAIRRVAV